jgi:hypothetical protein
MEIDRLSIRFWRWGLFLIVTQDTVLLSWMSARGSQQSPLIFVLLGLLTCAAGIQFLRRSAQLRWAALWLTALVLYFHLYSMSHVTARETFIQSGASLLGWTAGLLYAWGLGWRPERSAREREQCERMGAQGALSLFAATYVNAGLSKLLHGGLAWAQAPTIRLMILTQPNLDSHSSLLQLARQWVVASPRFTLVLAGSALVFELGAFMLTVGPRWRFVWGFLLLGMHSGIKLLSDIGFTQARLLCLLYAMPWPFVVRKLGRWLPRLRENGEPASAQDELTAPAVRHVMTVAMVLILIVTCAALAGPD